MTNSPPPDPQSPQREPLGFDEFIGIFVAFTTIGAILLWSSQSNQQITSILSPSPSPSAQPPLTPSSEEATISSSPALSPLPTVVPTESPDVLTPAPLIPRIQQRIPAAIVPSTTTPATPIPTPIPTPTPSATASPGEPIKFVDVPDGYWARPFIDALSARGIVNGFAGEYFRPDQTVTRAEFAAVLQDAFDQSPGQTTTPFNDVPSDFWAVKAIDRATTTGFLKGYPENVFRPEQRIPRAQILVALASGLNLTTNSTPAQTLQIYQDAAQIPNYATEKVAAATEAGLVVNQNPQLLEPNRDATRAEVSAIVYQALVRAGKAEPIESEYVIRGTP